MEPHDHREILDDDILLRGIPKQWIQPDPNGGHRISSAAFNASSDTYGGLSLVAKKALECLGRTVDDWAAGRFSVVVCFPAKMLRVGRSSDRVGPGRQRPRSLQRMGEIGRSVPEEAVATETPRQ